ncbi:MAG: methyltransferase domain-containing protein [Deltaproteobacteria bacterium]|nr:methyltransferase domain-containing protein [Deltaproteobacteria bacterium]
MLFARKKKSRPLEQIKAHYEIEKELAARLFHSPKEERLRLYSSLYNELFLRVPHHPQLVRKDSPQAIRKAVAPQLGFLRRFLKDHFLFVELGPGDCSLSLEVAKSVKGVVGLEVSREIAGRPFFSPNFQLALFDGCNLPLSNRTVDIVYSNQVMEHLHPDDAVEQLQSIFAILKPGGLYVCLTPNRINGPHDISRYFDRIATGFHLHEYTNTELGNLLTRAGFSKIRFFVRVRGYYFPFPFFAIKWGERFLTLMPYVLRKFLASRFPFRNLLGIRLGAVKAT